MDITETIGLSVAAVSAALAMYAVVVSLPGYRNSRAEASMAHFKGLVRDLREHHSLLTEAAYVDATDAWKPHGLHLLGDPAWILPTPVDLDQIELALQADPQSEPPEVERERRRLLRSAGLRASPFRYSQALQQSGLSPNIYDGKLYRILGANAVATGLVLNLGLDSYFRYLDSSEVLALEAQQCSASGRSPNRGAYRRALIGPSSFDRRVAALGIVTLTIRCSPSGATFFAHRRDGDVTHNHNLLGVAPAGEFAPSDLSLEAEDEDLDIWRTIMREYAEEFLGHPDAHRAGGAGINYESSEPYASLLSARREGTLLVRAFGLATDPLTWKPCLLTVCVFDALQFDAIFSGLVERNEEGDVISRRGKLGIPFDGPSINRYIHDSRTTPDLKDCLRLAWKHRELLGLDR
ncbi:hypothetical protein [Nocardioides sp. NPDC127503]|uniref:hypothetical protein n=1 Tax=Nocardioides sp. NPDC127503 TaxID=3154516 RepID=UPI0033190568